MHHHRFEFLLGITVIPREIERERLEPQTSTSGAQGTNHLESAGMFARKLLVDYKITGGKKQMSPGCIFTYEVLDRLTKK